MANEPLTKELFGYLNPIYGASLGYLGLPIRLPRSGGCLLSRPIPGTSLHDAIGPYPLLCCTDWSALADDFEDLEEDFVSITAVADPLSSHGGISGLSKAFPDLLRPFKQHCVVDLRLPVDCFVSSHHRYYARRALKLLKVECVHHPLDYLDEWTNLYSVLSKRHLISSFARFSRNAFRQQLAIPGLIMLRALHGSETVGMTLWYQQQDRVYSHLSAYNAKGYALRASYALFGTALDLFAAQGMATLLLGAGAGLENKKDGLLQFKRGWATGTCTAYLCGRICNRQRNADLVKKYGFDSRDFFPPYRAMERHAALASVGLLS